MFCEANFKCRKEVKGESYTLQDFLEDEDLIQELCSSTPKALKL